MNKNMFMVPTSVNWWSAPYSQRTCWCPSSSDCFWKQKTKLRYFNYPTNILTYKKVMDKVGYFYYGSV